MKTLYQCEKCGKTFEGENAWENTRACENSHLDIETGFIYTKEFNEHLNYSDGGQLPISLVLCFDEYDSETGKNKRYYATYNKGKDLEGARLEKLTTAIAERERKEAEDSARWRAERAERERLAELERAEKIEE